MSRNRHGGGRDRGGRNYGGGGDGLLGEGPGMGGGMYEPVMNAQMNQLMLAQQLLQQQQSALGNSAAFSGGGDFGMGDLGALGALAGAVGNMQYLQSQQGMGFGGAGGMRNDRKRIGRMNRDNDFKRPRRDSSGRGGDRDRSRGRDSNRSGESRDRNRSSRWDSDRDRKRNNKGDVDYDPAEPTEDEEARDKDSNLYCHVCNVSVYDDESFRRHLNGTKHTQRMNSVLTVHQMKSNQLKSRLKAEEHLRKIEGKKAVVDPDYFCKLCNNTLTIPWDRHRYSNIHKQRMLQVRRGCGWCHVYDFTNFTEVLKHRETEEHKKNAELYGKPKGERSRSRSRSGERRNERSRVSKGSSSQDRLRRDRDRKEKEREKKKKEEEEEDLTIPEFNPENPVGLNYVIPVTGFFCKLCHKFYNNEKSAKGSHCQSEAHYERFKLATQAKIDARQKRLEAEAAAEAERKAKEEEEKKAKGGDDVEMADEKADKEGTEKGDGEEDEEEEDVEDDEDYDDDLPLEDEDDEGGLAKDDDFSLTPEVELGDVSKTTDASMGETNSSFTFLSGDMATAHMELQRQEQLMQQKKAQDAAEEGETSMEDTDVSEAPADATPQVAEASADDSVVELSGEGEKEEDSSINLSQEDVETSTPVATKPAKGRGGTARRGRGRGKAKK